MSSKKSHWVHTTNIKSDSKVVTKPTNAVTIHKGDVIKASGDYRSAIKKSVAEVNKRRLTTKTNTLNTFSPLGKNHGVITQSALMELRAAGLR